MGHEAQKEIEVMHFMWKPTPMTVASTIRRAKLKASLADKTLLFKTPARNSRNPDKAGPVDGC